MSDRWMIVPVSQRERRDLVASWVVWHWRVCALEDGVQAVARRLRKYGFPLMVTLRILGITPTVVPAQRSVPTGPGRREFDAP
ncbi:MAG: hypothetical protein KA200_00050 [Burkholderiales bacterium]|nr:hypothetical protein [Burkholderiales bacterium]